MRTKPNPDISGQRFSRLLVISWRQSKKKKGFVWKCLCDCGCFIEVRGDGLKSGHSKSCGCLKRDLMIVRQTKHGASGTLTYNSWIGMLGRCNDPDNENYRNYGARGIKVCSEWLDYNAFVKSVGLRPSKDLTIERINNSGNYEPGNVKWATCTEQGNNRRTNRIVELSGERMTATQAARRVGINPSTLLGRLNDGWGFDKAIIKPIRQPTNPIGINGGSKQRKPKTPAPEAS